VNTLLQAILKDEHRAHGLSISEDEDYIYLWQTNHRKPVATFSARGVAIKAITDEADKYLRGDVVQELARVGGIEFK
jgi:hypothetical protein